MARAALESPTHSTARLHHDDRYLRDAGAGNPATCPGGTLSSGVMLAGRVIGISHDDPVRCDPRLEDGGIVSNIPEPAIGALMALP